MGTATRDYGGVEYTWCAECCAEWLSVADAACAACGGSGRIELARVPTLARIEARLLCDAAIRYREHGLLPAAGGLLQQTFAGLMAIWVALSRMDEWQKKS